MKKLIVSLTFVAASIIAPLLAAQSLQPQLPPPGWLQGAIEGINLEQRQIIVAEQNYRIALRASITDFTGAKLGLEDLDLSYAIAYRLDKENGDILDLQVIAYP